VRTLVPAIASCIVIAAAPAVVRGADVSVSVAARSIQPGELAVLTVTTPTPVDEVRVRGLGRDLTPIRVSETEWKILVGIDLETKPGRYDVSVVTGLSDAGRVTQLLTVLPRTFTTRKLTVDAAFVNPPPK